MLPTGPPSVPASFLSQGPRGLPLLPNGRPQSSAPMGVEAEAGPTAPLEGRTPVLPHVSPDLSSQKES